MWTKNKEYQKKRDTTRKGSLQNLVVFSLVPAWAKHRIQLVHVSGTVRSIPHFLQHCRRECPRPELVLKSRSLGNRSAHESRATRVVRVGCGCGCWHAAPSLPKQGFFQYSRRVEKENIQGFRLAEASSVS